MKHEPVDTKRGATARPAHDEVDDRLDALLATLPPCPAVPSTEAETAEAVARARADHAAGRFYDMKLVREWADTLPEHDSSFRDWIAARDA